MSHPYVEHYPNGQNINGRLDEHEKRIKELESKLGAASVIGSKAQASEATARRQEAGATPSVSGYIRWGTEHQQDDIFAADRLAAAVAAFCEREWSNKGLDQAWDLNRLGEIALAFVRGEPLPQKGG